MSVHHDAAATGNLRTRHSCVLWVLLILLLQPNFVSTANTYQIGAGSPVKEVPFRVYISGGVAVRVGVVKSENSCSGLQADGGSYIPLDSLNSAWFTIIESGINSICVIDDQGDFQFAGSVEISEITFTPSHLFRGQPSTLVFSSSFLSGSGSVIVSARSSCDPDLATYGPLNMVNFEAHLTPQKTSSGFVCILWPGGNPITPTTDLWVSVGELTVSEPFQFFPDTALRNDNATFEINTAGFAKNSRAAVSLSYTCDTFVLEPVQMVDHDVTFLMKTGEAGNYYLCVELPSTPGFFVSATGSIQVNSYTFTPGTLMSGLSESITLGGAVTVPNTIVTFHDTADCSSEAVAGPLQSNNFVVSDVVLPSTNAVVWVCIKKPPPDTEFILSDAVTVQPEYTIDTTASTKAVLGMAGVIKLSGGSPSDSNCKVVPVSESCEGSAGLLTGTAVNHVVEFTYILSDIGDFRVCVETPDQSRWISAGTITVELYTLTTVSVMLIAGRGSTFIFDESTSGLGVNMSFALRQPLISDACLTINSNNDVIEDVTTYPLVPMSVEFPKFGTWDLCLGPDTTFKVGTVVVVEELSFLPNHGVLNTPVVLVFGSSVPTGSNVVLVPALESDASVEVNCVDSNISSVVMPNRTALFELNQTSTNPGTYHLCIEIDDTSGFVSLPKHDNFTIHSDVLPTFTIVANVSRQVQLSTFSLDYEIPYTSKTGPEEVVESHRYKIYTITKEIYQRNASIASCPNSYSKTDWAEYVEIDSGLTGLTQTIDLYVDFVSESRLLIICAEISVSPYLFLPDDFFWTPVAFLNVSDPIVVVDPAPGPTPGTDPNTLANMVVGLPYKITLSGSVSPGTLVKLTSDTTCISEVPGGHARELSILLDVDFTVETDGVFMLCALGISGQWIGIRTYEAVAISFAPRELYFDNPEYRKLVATLVTYQEVDITSMHFSKADNCENANLIGNHMKVFEHAEEDATAHPPGSGYINARLPTTAKDIPIITVCGRQAETSTAEGLYPIKIGTVVNSAKPIVEQHTPLQRKSPWEISITGDNVVGSVVLKLGSCADSSAVVDGGFVRTYTRGAVVKFIVDLQVGGILALCATASRYDREYLVNIGFYQVGSFFKPTTLLSGRVEDMSLSPNTEILGSLNDQSFVVLMDSPICNLTESSASEGPFWVVKEFLSQTTSTVSVLLPRQSRLLLADIYVCVGFITSTVSRDIKTLASIDGISNEIKLSEVGVITILKDSFAVEVTPKVVRPGEAFSVRPTDDSDKYVGTLIKLSNSSSCEIDIHPAKVIKNGEVTFTMDVHDQKINSGDHTPTVCVSTADGTNWFPGITVGNPGYLQLPYVLPVAHLLGSTSTARQTIEDIEVGWGSLQFSFSDPFCSVVMFAFPIVNHTALVTIPVVEHSSLWVCYDGAPAGSVSITAPPKLTTSYYPITVGSPVVLTAAHDTLPNSEFVLRLNSEQSPILENGYLLDVSDVGRLPVFVEFKNMYPGIVLPLGEISIRPFLRADQPALISDEIQQILLPDLEGKSWQISLKQSGSDCATSNVNDTLWTDDQRYSTSVAVSITEFVDEVMICADGMDVGTIPVVHIWDFDITPTYAVHNLSRSVSLFGKKKIPTEGRVLLINEAAFGEQLSCDSFASMVDDGLTSVYVTPLLQKNGVFNTPPTATSGNHTICVEVVADSGVYHKVSSPLSMHGISVSNHSALQACTDTSWSLSVDYVPYSYSISTLQLFMIIGTPMLDQCCSPQLGEYTMINMSLSLENGVSEYRSDHYFDEPMSNPMLVCLRTQDHCYELKSFSEGVSGCVVIPLTTPPDRRIGGAADPFESEDISEGAIIGIVVVVSIILILCLVCIWRFVVPKFNQKPEEKKKDKSKLIRLQATTSSLSVTDGNSDKQNGSKLKPNGVHKNGKSNGLVSKPVSAFTDGSQNGVSASSYTARPQYPPLQSERVAMLGSVAVDIPHASSFANGNSGLGVHNRYGSSTFLSAPRQFSTVASPPPSVISSHPNHGFQPIMNGTSTYSAMGGYSPNAASDHYNNHSNLNGGLQNMLSISPGQVSVQTPRSALDGAGVSAPLRNPLHVSEEAHYTVPPPAIRPTTAPDPSVISAASTQQPPPATHRPATASSPFRVSEGDLIGRTPAEIDALLRRWQGIQQSERLECETHEDVSRNQLIAEEQTNRITMKDQLDHQVRVVEVDRRKSKAREENNQQEMARALKQAQKLQEKKERAEKALREEEKRAKEEEQLRQETEAKMKQQDAELEQKRAAQEEEERKATQKRLQRERDMRARLEAEEARNERVETAGALDRHEKDVGLTFHRLLQQVQREEKKERDIIEQDDKTSQNTIKSLFDTDTQAMKAFLAKITHEEREREKAEVTQRNSLQTFEEDSRNTIGTAEQTDWDSIVNSSSYELSKKKQINELLKQQKELEKERASDREKQEREREQRRIMLNEDKRLIEQDRVRIEEEKLLLQAAKKAQQEEEFHRKAEALKEKAKHEQRLLEDNMLMAERASQARLSEERIRKEVEGERRKLMEERRAVEAWRRKVEQEMRDGEAAALKLETKKKEQEEALLKERAKAHDNWMGQINVIQDESEGRHEVELEAWSEWDKQLTDFQSGCSGISEEALIQQSADRAKQRRAEEHESQLKAMGAQGTNRTRNTRVKDSCVELLRVLSKISEIPPDGFSPSRTR